MRSNKRTTSFNFQFLNLSQHARQSNFKFCMTAWTDRFSKTAATPSFALFSHMNVSDTWNFILLCVLTSSAINKL